jgi:hypothetical protein
MSIVEELKQAYGGELPPKLFIPKVLWPDHFHLLSTRQVLELIDLHTNGSGTKNRQTINKWKKRGWLTEQRRGRPPGRPNQGRGNSTSFYFKGEVLEVLHRLEHNMITSYK